MKQNLGTYFLTPRRVAGAVMLALFAFIPVSQAQDVIVNNTGASVLSVSGTPFAQVFTMSGTSGTISSLTLELNSTGGGTATVSLYSVSSGTPTSLLYNLGTVTAGTSGNNQLIAVSSLNNVSLSAGTQYAIAMQYPSSGSIGWDAVTSTASGGDAPSLGGQYLEIGSVWFLYNQNNSFQMDLQTTPVPEVPVTGAVMGFGALAIALGHTLRRKLGAAVSSIG